MTKALIESIFQTFTAVVMKTY